MTTHKITSGETLTSIAKKYNTTVDEIAKANGIQNKNLIYAGDTLNIPSVSYSGGYTSVESVPYTGTPTKVTSSAASDVEKAKSDLEKWQSQRPGKYKSAYDKELDSLISSLTGMEFEYDAENDPAFRMTRDESIRNALLAMEDTMGKASALTGGYGNTYAQGAAQQAYNTNLSAFTELIPELYSAAYGRFSDEREALGDSIRLLRDMDDSDFDRYTEIMKQYLSEGELLFDNYQAMSEEEFDRFLDYAELLQKSAK